MGQGRASRPSFDEFCFWPFWKYKCLKCGDENTSARLWVSLHMLTMYPPLSPPIPLQIQVKSSQVDHASQVKSIKSSLCNRF